MFENVLKRLDYVFIDDNEADQVFTVDATGRAVTLREYINRQQQDEELVMSTLSSRANARRVSNGDHKSLLEDPEVGRLVEQYLDSIPDDEVLAIVGKGTFSADELREEVLNRTPIGERVAHIVLDGRMFIEEAARQRKIKIMQNKEVSRR